ncbi:hypothetical protein H0H93_010435 [Arthromyces matolae]|nr:hypothetical protein H0H93_010435 [Arthromyces matolae]
MENPLLIPPTGLTDPKYNKAKKEWIDKWWEKRGNKKAYAGKVSQFESPKELEVYKEDAWLHNIPSRQSKLIIVERVKRGVTGYSKNDRDRMNRWEIQRHDHDKGSQFLFDLSTKRKEYESTGFYTEREIDNLLWHHRVRRMDYELWSSKKRKKRAETETMQPHLIEFGYSEEKEWNGRNAFQS